MLIELNMPAAKIDDRSGSTDAPAAIADTPAMASLIKRRRFLSYHRYRIEISVIQAKKQGKLAGSLDEVAFVRSLERNLCSSELLSKPCDILSGAESVRWAKIVKLLSVANDELSIVRFPRGRIQELNEQICQSLETCEDIAARLSEMVVLRKAGSDIVRERIFSTVLKAWIDNGGKLKAQHRLTKTQGPLAAYFFAVVEPLLGPNCPDLLGLIPIILREKSRRSLK